MRAFTSRAKQLLVSDGVASTSNATVASTENRIDDTPDLPPLPRDLHQHVVYARSIGRSFGEVAADLGLLKQSQVRDLLREQDDHGRPIDELAIAQGLLTQEQIEYVSKAPTFTIHVDGRHIAAPQFLTWTGDLAKRGIAANIQRATAQEIETLRQEQKEGAARQDHDLETLTLARRLVMESGAIGASDLAILVRETHAEVQVRVKGDNRLASAYTMRKDEGHALIRAVCVGLATDKDSYLPNEFQNAQIHGSEFPGTGISSARIIRGPAYPSDNGGAFLVARLQYRRNAKRTVRPTRSLGLKSPHSPPGALDIPGLTELQRELVERLVRLPMGVVLVTGPTGSGKTTTLYELMKYQAQIAPDLRQVTIENPPEYPMPWAIQLAAGDDDFREYVRHTLRMDPDIMLLGEIRKADEAVAVLQAAMTGHFVWSTLHVTDPYKSLTRLEMLDIDRLSLPTLCDHELLVALIAQRVVPRLCPDCKSPLHRAQHRLPAFMHDALKTWGDLSNVHVRGPGCETCDGDGIASRQAVAEFVLTTPEFMSDVLEHGLATARRNHRCRPGSDKSMLANAMDLVLAGEVDPAAVHKHVHVLQPKGDGV